MAQIVEIKNGEEKIYPITIIEAVIDAETNKNVKQLIEDAIGKVLNEPV